MTMVKYMLFKVSMFAALHKLGPFHHLAARSSLKWGISEMYSGVRPCSALTAVEKKIKANFKTNR